VQRHSDAEGDRCAIISCGNHGVDRLTIRSRGASYDYGVQRLAQLGIARHFFPRIDRCRAQGPYLDPSWDERPGIKIAVRNLPPPDGVRVWARLKSSMGWALWSRIARANSIAHLHRP
jgi:hypothetical protein